MAAGAIGSERGSPRARRTGLILGPAAFAILLLAPGIPLDPAQRRVAATTALTAIFWITLALPVGATALLPAVCFPLLGVMSAQEAAPTYMRHLVMLFIGAFIIALGLERWGVHRRMALWIIAKVGTSERRLVLGFMVASAFLSLWINNTATTLLMLPIAMAVLQRVEGGDRGTTRLGLCLLLGIAYSSSVGGMGTPVGTAPNQEFLGQFEQRFPDGPSIGFGLWFVAWAPLPLIFVPLAWLLLTRLVFPVAAGGGDPTQTIVQERAAQGPMTRPQVLMSMVFGATALLWVTRADLVLGGTVIPGWARLLLGEDAGYVSDATVASFMAVLCFALPAERGSGQHLMDWRTAAKLPWEVILLLGAGFCIAQGFRVSSLDEALGAGISPLFSGRSSWIVVAGVALFMSLLTEVTSNTATTAVLLPVITSAGLAAGLHPLLVMAPATIAASAAFMMPVATPPNAVVFASRRVPVPDMVRAGLWLNVLMVALITVVFQLWVRGLWDVGSAVPDWATGG